MEPGRVKALVLNGAEQTADAKDDPAKRRKSYGIPRTATGLNDTRRASEPRHRLTSLRESTGSSRRESRDPARMKELSVWKTEEDDSAGSPSQSTLSDNLSHFDVLEISDPGKETQEPRRSGLESYAESLDARNRANDPECQVHESIQTQPNRQIKAQIKADFFIEQVDTPKPCRLSSSASTMPPLRRKRRSLGGSSRLSVGGIGEKLPATIPINAPQPSQTSSTSTSNIRRSSSRIQKSNDSAERRPAIVMTSVGDKERAQCLAIVKRLGNFEVVDSVDERTTHVIVGRNRRTTSVMFGLLQGAWLVKLEWVLDSGKLGKYQGEEGYTTTEWFPRQLAARQRKSWFPPNVSICVLSTYKDQSLIRQLLDKSGANVVDSIDKADIIISKQPTVSDRIVVNENWLFHSIGEWRCPGTLFTLGAFGAAGAAAAYARRNSQSKAEDNDNATVTPHEFARRRSSGVKNDLWESRSQADHLWRRDYGASFSHNSYRHFPGSNKQHKT
ncbi:BRCA1 associated RING domain 1 [Apophysomyces sp. BC1021]|nr:BRCA1 associated RING domain 1 [Apophysomyces sp. BC1021]